MDINSQMANGIYGSRYAQQAMGGDQAEMIGQAAPAVKQAQQAQQQQQGGNFGADATAFSSEAMGEGGEDDYDVSNLVNALKQEDFEGSGGNVTSNGAQLEANDKLFQKKSGNLMNKINSMDEQFNAKGQEKNKNQAKTTDDIKGNNRA